MYTSPFSVEVVRKTNNLYLLDKKSLSVYAERLFLYGESTAFCGQLRVFKNRQGFFQQWQQRLVPG